MQKCIIGTPITRTHSWMLPKDRQSSNWMLARHWWKERFPEQLRAHPLGLEWMCISVLESQTKAWLLRELWTVCAGTPVNAHRHFTCSKLKLLPKTKIVHKVLARSFSDIYLSTVENVPYFFVKLDTYFSKRNFEGHPKTACSNSVENVPSREEGKLLRGKNLVAISGYSKINSEAVIYVLGEAYNGTKICKAVLVHPILPRVRNGKDPWVMSRCKCVRCLRTHGWVCLYRVRPILDA